MADHTVPDELESLLSAERLGTYHRHAPEWARSPISLYLLGSDLAASMHRDLGVAEVVLRNAMNDVLADRYGPRPGAARRTRAGGGGQGVEGQRV